MEALEELQSAKGSRRELFGIQREKRRQVEIDESLETLAHYLDELITIPVVGWKFGLDAIIGLIPGIGDTATSIASFYILISAVRYGVPKITILRMALNIAIDYVVGTIPFIGDAFDFVWKSNKLNMNLLRERATGKGNSTAGDWFFVMFIILSLIGLLAGSVLLTLFILGTLLRTVFTQLS